MSCVDSVASDMSYQKRNKNRFYKQPFFPRQACNCCVVHISSKRDFWILYEMSFASPFSPRNW